MLVKLTEICSNGAVTVGHRYKLREVFINPEHVILIREDVRIKELNENGNLRLPGTDILDKSHRFSKLVLNRGQSGAEIVVVGAPGIIEKTLKLDNRQLLKG